MLSSFRLFPKIFTAEKVNKTMIGASRISTFVFLDLETTALKFPEITELSMVAAERKHIIQCSTTEAKELPRLLDKFTVCVKPSRKIESRASGLTGISDEDLMGRRPFDTELGSSVLNFLCRQVQPVCLVAHNGDNFDFKVLVSHLGAAGLSLPDTVQASDSLKAFRKLSKETQPTELKRKSNGKRVSFSLSNLFNAIVGGNIENAHSAEGDALAILQLVIHKPEVLEILESDAHVLDRN